MIEFRHIVSKNVRSYRCRFSGLLQDSAASISMKWDTGAANTILSAKSLGFSDESIDFLGDYLKSRGTFFMNFESASGHGFKGYLCCVTNVVCGDSIISKFYYFIGILKKPLALLGDDFITYCLFNHGIEGGILVSSFSQDKYDNYFNNLSGGKFIDSVEIDEVCNAGLTAELISERIRKNGVRGLDNS